ncbi:chemotaxis protein methyltransferase [Acidocella aquatica]|uniref:Chemotaxis protein methyltransferase n=1 Tax=Acidocella aquatica TaxID=1922313 RepID=A0ABQ6A4Y4_9PROT|nr:protein-glutamate O-methyltransferase CheR [Acidocella aquatica]GLR67524.1 chemotaxis protein methyltransferase [Acidocella aquatica]
MMAGTDVVTISESEFEKFRDFFYRRTGILFTQSKRYYVDKRLLQRISAAGMESFEQYFMRLRRDAGEEIEQLINLFTVNETYFYREENQFGGLANHILPELTAHLAPGSRIRIWSLPCSTGEEPYSIALYLLENWPEIENYEVELLASDIDTRALSAARAGIYDARALHRLPRDVVRRYFVKLGEDQFRLSNTIRQAVSFSRVNASDPREMRAFEQIDVIFCRNMLIYFDDRARRRTVEAFYKSLHDGGFVCLGHSESMSRISPLFRVRPFPGAVVYQKAGG